MYAALILVANIVVSIVGVPGGADVQNSAGASIADLGTVSRNLPAVRSGVRIAERSNSYVVETIVGLRTTASGLQTPVSLQAFLDVPMAGVSVSIDGVTLSTIPRTFAVNVPLGAITTHKIDIEIPNTMDPARVPADIPLEFGAVQE